MRILIPVLVASGCHAIVSFGLAAGKPPNAQQVEIITPEDRRDEAYPALKKGEPGRLMRAALAEMSKSSPGQDEDLKIYAAALDFYVKAVRKTDFTDQEWAIAVDTQASGSWMGIASRLNRIGELSSALEEALRHCPKGKASPAASRYFSQLVNDYPDRTSPDEAWKLPAVIVEQQPQLLSYCREKWTKFAGRLEKLGWNAEATKLARAILIAPELLIPKDDSSEDQGYNSEQNPYAGAAECVRLALLGSPGTFVNEMAEAAHRRVRETHLTAFALALRAQTTGLKANDLRGFHQWSGSQKLELAEKTLALMDDKGPALKALKPWYEEGLRELFAKPPGDDFVSGVHGLASLAPRLRILGLEGTMQSAVPRLIDSLVANYLPDFEWEGVATLVLSFGTEEDKVRFLKRWQLDWEQNFNPEENRFNEDAPASWAKTSFVATGIHRRAMALWARDLLLELLKRMPPDWEPRGAKEVLEALLAAGLRKEVADLLPQLEKRVLPGRETAWFKAFFPFKAMLATLDPGEKTLPGVVVWTQEPAGTGSPVRVQWDFVAAPNRWVVENVRVLDDYPGQKSGQPDNALAGLRSPLLQELSGRYDLAIETRINGVMKEVAIVPGAAASGTVEVGDLPPTGWLTATVKSRKTGGKFTSPARLYSLHPALLRTGPEPDGAAPLPTMAPAPVTGKDAADVPRWDGLTRFEYGKPVSAAVAVDPDATYLLTIWRSDLSTGAGFHEFGPPMQYLWLRFLDAERKPIAGADWGLTSEAMDSYGRIMEPRMTQYRFQPSWRFRSSCGANMPEIGAASRIRYVVLVAFEQSTQPAPLFQLRLFEQKKNEVTH